MNRLSLTLKSWAKSLAFVSTALPETVSNRLWAACCRLSVCSCHDKQEVSCHMCFHLSHLHYGCQHCSGHSLHEVHEDIQFSGIIYALLKFTVYGCKQRNRHTHASCNAVLLVWGSLSLAPVKHTVKHNYILKASLTLLAERKVWPTAWFC